MQQELARSTARWRPPTHQLLTLRAVEAVVVAAVALHLDRREPSRILRLAQQVHQR
jgi:Mn2+/Fe2+ NRAMP family transporter